MSRSSSPASPTREPSHDHLRPDHRHLLRHRPRHCPPARPPPGIHRLRHRPQGRGDRRPRRQRARLLPLDVTDEESMRAAVTAVEAAHGQVDVLVNNAGYGEYGPIEEAPLDRVRAQFETNVFGLSRLTQLVLPGMRRAGRGRIVNVSSMGGRLVFPGGGYYHASKYAVEAISDALRQEVRPFGIDVAVVEPGLIRTGFGAVAAKSLGAGDGPAGPYRTMVASVDAAMAKSYANPMLAATPETVARVIERAVTARHPRTRYLVTAAAWAMVHTRRLFGARVFD
ncbi:SDR family NAD(P)-dependent oxidoreductase, partial [Micromonospora sp. 4G55]|uniref:SDR family NAD(P)-dependent oxidoreductase n=1 Tax=Micromonospora sp. 4G55 TaxID=2806102 RepID=UPI001A38FCEB